MTSLPPIVEITLPSADFPFSRSELSCFNYGNYTLRNVFRTINDEQRAACVEMWLRNKALPSAESAWQRAEQVCYLLTETATGRLVGVNTLYVDSLVTGGPQFFLNRMFIEPDYRNSRLMIIGTRAMLCYAKTHLSGEGLSGVVNINENTKLARPAINRLFHKAGYRKQGQLNGKDVWYFEFARIAIRG